MKRIATGVYKQDEWRLESMDKQEAGYGYCWVLYGPNESLNYFDSKKQAVAFIEEKSR